MPCRTHKDNPGHGMIPFSPVGAARAVPGAATGLQKALTGDFYVRKWTSVRGKGKDKKVVEHELHFNPLVVFGSLALGAGAVLLGGATAWASGMRLGQSDEREMKRYVRVYDAIYVTEKVIDEPGGVTQVWGVVAEEGHWADVPAGIVVCPIDGSELNETTETEQKIARWYEHHAHSAGAYQYRSTRTYIVDVPAHEGYVSMSTTEVSHMQTRLLKGSWALVLTSRNRPLFRYDAPNGEAAPELLLTTREKALGWAFDTAVTGPIEGKDRLGRYVLMAYKYKLPDSKAFKFGPKPEKEGSSLISFNPFG